MTEVLRPSLKLALPRALLALTGLSGSTARAVTATGLSSFEAIEEPLVRYHPASGKFEPDPLINITEVGPGTFRMLARYNSDWWDGDRDTINRDRQRAEVKGLGPHQRRGETFEYTTTWRSNPGFRGSSGFCHLFQLKATNGDSGAPLITLSIRGNNAVVEANPAGPKVVAREFPWRPDTWQTVRIRVRTSPKSDGELMVSVDGDPFQGITGVALSRPQSDAYRPKWGLYRRAAVNAPMADDFVEHKAVTAQKIGAPKVENGTLEVAARARINHESIEKTLAWLLAQPASDAREFATASLAALWAETQPAAAMSWAEKLPRGLMRTDAIGRTFSRWADRDVIDAAQWLLARGPNRERDQLVWLFVTDTTYRYVKREIALDAARLISDAKLRAEAFEHVLEIWSRSEPAAALAFLEKTPALTVEQKRAIAGKLRARLAPRKS